jgi:phage terminase large subunit-like protein
LLTAHLCGPPARLNSQLYSAAQSRDQAGLIFNYAVKMIRMSPVLSRAVTIRESAKELLCPALGTRYKALSADASTAMGLNPTFAIFDELGQVKGPRSALYEALETATGAQVDPLVVIISTQARSDNDLLSILIDDALTGSDPRTVVSLYTAPPELDPFAEATIRLANPAYGTFLNPVEVLDMARAAQRMPARQSEYESLVLNRRLRAPIRSWRRGCGRPAALRSATSKGCRCMADSISPRWRTSPPWC